MRTREPADKHYGEKRPLGPGVHVARDGYQLARAASTNNSNDPSTFGVNPINWKGFGIDAQDNRVMASPYGDTTVVQPPEGMVLTANAQQRVIPRLGLNENIGASDAQPQKQRLNPTGVALNPPPARGMSTSLKLGSGPQRNVPKA